MFNLGDIEKKNELPLRLSAIVQKKVKLAAFTSFKIGGNADIYSVPSSLEELKALLSFFYAEQIPAILMGGGSNLLIPDTGIAGAVVHTKGLNTIKLHEVNGEPLVEAAAGVLMQDVLEFCAAKGLGGLEDFAGLPGTVGGAVFMNARCYEKSISDVLESTSVLYFSGKGFIIEECTCCQEEWGYKYSPFQPANGRFAALDAGRLVIVGAKLKTVRRETSLIREKMQERIADRTAKGQFRFPSAGSVFKNNHTFGKPSGKLIDEAGLRGFRIGGAQVAPWHGNFIVNTGSATAEDVMELIKTVQERVRGQTGFELEPEIIFAG